MKREEIAQLAKDSLADLRNAIRAGKTEDLTRYLDVMSRFHSYSFRNSLLIAAQAPQATHVAGFKAWLGFGRCVRKGEKAIAIIAPMAYRNTEATDSADQDGRQIRGFRAAHVFDVSQTEGEELPKPAGATGKPGPALQALTELVATKGVALQYADSLDGAHGRSRRGEITLLRGLSPAEEFSTLAHELAHELLHWRDERPEEKRVCETEAEAVAYVVARAVGLEARTAASDYILFHGGDDAAMEGSLGRIQRVSAEIIGALKSAA